MSITLAYVSGCGYVELGEAVSGALEFSQSRIYNELKESSYKLSNCDCKEV
ncbi:MAG: hypothetical protein AB7G87_08955 [Clostridia bacterium]